MNYNTWMWEKVIDVSRLYKKLKGFRFHHEITTNGVAASVLFSRTVKGSDGKSKKRRVYQGVYEDELPSFPVEWIWEGEI